MSLRGDAGAGAACAPVVGANHNTVARDLRSVTNDTDAPRAVKSLDGVGGTRELVRTGHLSGSPLAPHGLHRFSKWKIAPTSSPLYARGLHFIPQLCGIRLGIAAAKVPNGPIVSAPTWAAPFGLSHLTQTNHRLRAYVGGTLADQHPRP